MTCRETGQWEDRALNLRMARSGGMIAPSASLDKLHNMRAALRFVVSACLVAASAFVSARQDETLRVNGQILAEGGGPVRGARIRTDALRGAMARPFGGQREFRANADENGEWSLLGVTRGLWVLEISARDHLPAAVVVPISMMLKPMPIPWDTSLALLPVVAILPPDAPKNAPERYILDAAEKVASGDLRAARQALQKLAGASLTAGGLASAGDVALLVRDPAMARRFFELATTAAPDWYRPQLGIASAAMLTFDVDRAMKAYAAARAATGNKRLEVMLSSAIKDLQQIRSVGLLDPPGL
jgi:hypothetical protein